MIHSKKWALCRLFVLLLFLASIGLAAISISSLRIDNRSEIWFYDQDPAIKSYERGHDQFGDWDWMSVYLTPQDGIYAEPFLRAVNIISNKIKALSDVRKVISMTNARGNRLDNDELSYQSILGSEPWKPTDLEQLRKTLEANPIYAGGLIKPGSDQSTLVLVQVKNRGEDKEAYRVKLVDEIHHILRDQRATIADFAIVGSPFLNAELNRSSRHDMLVFYPLVSLLVMLIAWFIFRNIRDVATVFLALTGATAWSVGQCHALYRQLPPQISRPSRVACRDSSAKHGARSMGTRVGNNIDHSGRFPGAHPNRHIASDITGLLCGRRDHVRLSDYHHCGAAIIDSVLGRLG